MPSSKADLSRAPAAAAAVPAEPAPQPLRYAAAEPDPGQVRQAWVAIQDAYADGGSAALIRASAACAERLPADPQRLDYCLALDIYGAAIARDLAAADWFGEARERDLALARAALPRGVDPANRLAQLGELTRAVLPRSEPARAKPVRLARAEVRRSAAEIRHPAASVRKTNAHAGRAAAKSRIARVAQRRPARLTDARCAGQPTIADRLVCAHPDLASADDRMRTAYHLAVASGVDPEILSRQQQAWRESRDRAVSRAGLAALYRQRISDLEALAPPR